MRYILFILFFSMSLLTLAQQTIELCAGESKTVKYFSEPSNIGNNIWTVNGLIYGDEDTLTYTFNSSGTYNIVLKRENVLCYVEQSIQVIVNDCPGIIYWIPNTFTPDGNEFNQTFGPVIFDKNLINYFNLKIYNRWGQTVWESNDINSKWDGYYKGKLCQDGVYNWTVEIGLSKNSKKITNRGHLTILR